jgi:hypothetical protein
MNITIRRSLRTLVLLLVATSLGACHFHGHHGRHCHGFGFAPVRHCR